MSNVSVVGEMFKMHGLPIMQQKSIFMQYPIRDNNNKNSATRESSGFFTNESLCLSQVDTCNKPFKARLQQVCDAITVLRLCNLKIILIHKELFLVMSGSSSSHIPHI